jgi:hypothetical protein
MPATQDDLAKITTADLPLNGVILNAGGIGTDTTRPANNVLNIQMNVGNLQLIEILRDAKKLASGCRIVYSGRLLIGVPMMMMGNLRYGRH